MIVSHFKLFANYHHLLLRRHLTLLNVHKTNESLQIYTVYYDLF